MLTQFEFCNDFFKNETAICAYSKYTNCILPGLITIVSSKGGIGKTTLSKEIAVMYSMLKNKERPLKVCIMDFAFNSADIDIVMNVRNDCNIYMWMEDIKTRLANKSLWYEDILYTKEQIDLYFEEGFNGIKLLLAPDCYYDGCEKDKKILKVILQNIASYGFDVIICDTSNCYNGMAMEMARMSEYVYVVADRELTTLRRTQQMIYKYKNEGILAETIKFVLNETKPETTKNPYSDEQILQFIGMNDIHGEIPYEKRMSVYSIKKTFAVLETGTRFSDSIKKLALKPYYSFQYKKGVERVLKKKITK